MTAKIKVSGFDSERYAHFPILEVPIASIEEPRLVTQSGAEGYRDPERVRRYARLLEAGSPPPPIELIETRSADGRPLKQPYSIYNGQHRYGAAVLAGRPTLPAVIAWVEVEPAEEFREDEFATNGPVLTFTGRDRARCRGVSGLQKSRRRAH